MRYIALMLALHLAGCGAGFDSGFQPSAISPNQEYMMGEMRRFEPMLNMGQFVMYFKKPPYETYAGWAFCNPGGSPPWVINFNDKYIETLGPEKTAYMSAIVAHEMCHHWVSSHNGRCGDEVAAETCAHNLMTIGRPN